MGTGRFFDTNTGKEIGRLEKFCCNNYDNHVSPDGKYLVVNWKNSVNIFDLQTNKLVKSVPEIGTSCRFVVSPNFEKFVAGENNNRVVYRLSDAAKLFTFSGMNGKTLRQIVFTGDSKRFLVSDSNPGVRLYDSATGKILMERDLSDTGANMPQVGFLGGESYFYVTLKSGELGIYETATFQQIKKIFLNNNYLTAIQFSPDGMFGAAEHIRERVDIFSLETGEIIRTDMLGEKELSSFAADFPRNRLYYGGADGTIRVLRTTNWTWTHCVEGVGRKINRLFISPDGNRLATQHLDTVEIFETKTFSRIATLPIKSDPTMFMLPVVQFSPSFKFAISLARIDELEKNTRLFEIY